MLAGFHKERYCLFAAAFFAERIIFSNTVLSMEGVGNLFSVNLRANGQPSFVASSSSSLISSG